MAIYKLYKLKGCCKGRKKIKQLLSAVLYSVVCNYVLQERNGPSTQCPYYSGESRSSIQPTHAYYRKLICVWVLGLDLATLHHLEKLLSHDVRLPLSNSSCVDGTCSLRGCRACHTPWLTSWWCSFILPQIYSFGGARWTWNLVILFIKACTAVAEGKASLLRPMLVCFTKIHRPCKLNF